MDTGAFDRLARLFGALGTRRAALGVLLGATLLVPALERADGKKLQRRGKRKRRGRRSSVAKNPEAAPVQAQKQEEPQCVSPFGLNLNEFYNVSEPIASSFCPPIDSERQWRVASRWDTAPTFEVYDDDLPDGLVLEGDTPQEDFIAKFQSVKYVIDAGSKRERSVVFPKIGNLFQGEQDGLDVTSPITLGVLEPLAVGKYTVDVIWRLSAMHCDGLGEELGVNCLAAGEFFYTTWEFKVKPGQH
jgi:hypothetical protein